MSNHAKRTDKLWIYVEVVGKPAPRSSSVSTPFGTIFHKHAQLRKVFTNPAHDYANQLKWKPCLYMGKMTPTPQQTRQIQTV